VKVHPIIRPFYFQDTSDPLPLMSGFVRIMPRSALDVVYCFGRHTQSPIWNCCGRYVIMLHQLPLQNHIAISISISRQSVQTTRRLIRYKSLNIAL